MKYTVRQIFPKIDECLIPKKLFVEQIKNEISFQLAKELPFEVKENIDGIIVSLDVHIMTNYDYRNPNTDKNLLPSKETAEAMLALCQLIQLRDCYNQDWKPDWTSDYAKYCIVIRKNAAYKDAFFLYSHILSFKTEELRDQFYDNFKDLIEIAKPLL